MSSEIKARENLKDFNAYVDENGQTNPDAPQDVARPAELQRVLASDPSGEAETARIASGQADRDGTEATEAEVPPGVIEKLGNASLGEPQASSGAEDAVERATSSLGKP